MLLNAILCVGYALRFLRDLLPILESMSIEAYCIGGGLISWRIGVMKRSQHLHSALNSKHTPVQAVAHR